MKLVVGIFIITTHYERVVSDSFLAKRIPGDVRSSFRGVVNAIAMLFTFGFHLAAYKILTKGYNTQSPLIIVAGLDGLAVYLTIFIALTDLYPKMTTSESIKSRKAAEKADPVNKFRLTNNARFASSNQVASLQTIHHD